MKSRLNSRTLVPTALLLVMIVLLARSIEQARWTEGLHVLAPIGVLGILLGIVLSTSRLGTLRAHLLGMLGGMLVVLWQTGRVLSPEELQGASGTLTVWSRFREWLALVLAGGTSSDELLFVFTMGIIVWFLAYNNAWFVLRYGWVWWAVIPTGLVMLVNLGYATRPNNRFFVLFLLASMLLMVQQHVARREDRWERDGLGREGGLGLKVLLLGSILSIVLLGLAWRGPSRSIAITARNAFQQAAKPFDSVQDRWEKAFAFLYPSSRPAPTGLGTGFTSFRDSFALGGPLRLGTRTVFTATGESSQYWRSVAYDTYTGSGWELSTPSAQATEAEFVRGQQLSSTVNQRELKPGTKRVEQEVEVVLPVGRPLFAADVPVLADRSAVWQLPLIERQVEAPVRGKLSDTVLQSRGAELGRLRGLLRQREAQYVASASNDGIRSRRTGSLPSARPTPATGSPSPARAPITREALRQYLNLLREELSSLSTRGIDATYRYRPGSPPVITYTFMAPDYDTVLDFGALEPVQKGEKYKVTSIVANPTNAQLAKAVGKAPEWVNDEYLQLPENLPKRVVDLARKLTANADTPDEKARAIETYLRKLKYRENVPAPLPGRDFVDTFLFDLKEGYCTSFASAMAVMLRSVDVPTRVVTGFAPGEYDSKIDRIVVNESKAHAWPQVYHPGYGWVNYEPTPIRDPVSRNQAGTQANQGSSELPDVVFNRRSERQLGEDPVSATQTERLPAYARLVLSSASILLLTVLLLYLISLIRLRGLRGATRQYAKLTHLGALLRRSPKPSQTPTEYVDWLSGALPNVAQPARRISRSYVAELFGRQTFAASELEGEWRRIVSGSATSLPDRLMRAPRLPALRALVSRLRRR